MNIKLTYFYRVAANYKQYHEVVFANPNELPIYSMAGVLTGHSRDIKMHS